MGKVENDFLFQMLLFYDEGVCSSPMSVDCCYRLLIIALYPVKYSVLKIGIRITTPRAII
jgi:hypothetical protein